MSPFRRRTLHTRTFALIACLALAPACSSDDGRPRLYRTAGKVTYLGNPLPGAFVVFRKVPLDDKLPSPTATTAVDGSFALTTYENDDGAPAGDYQVGISTTPARGERGLSIDKSDTPKDVLKGRFAEPKTSGLKATIKVGEDNLQPFELK